MHITHLACLERRVRLAVSLLLGLAAIGSSPAQAGWSTLARVGPIQSADGRGCTFFLLQGVTQADPIKPNDPYFALPQTIPGYQEMLSFLLSAQLSGRPIMAFTTGQLACGYPEVGIIMIYPQ